MVGDGLNDTAALAAAHVSISPASALDAARTASDMVLMGRSLAPIAGRLHDRDLGGAAHPRELHHRHRLQRAGRAAGHRGSCHAADRRLGDVDVFDYGLAERIAVEVSTMDVLGILIPVSLFLGLAGAGRVLLAAQTRAVRRPGW
jgi:hypothetical protein